MDSILSRVSEAEIKMIERYVDAYAIGDGEERQVSGETLLSPWADAKAQYLSKMFPDGLIMSKEIKYSMDIEEIATEIMANQVITDFYHTFYTDVINPLFLGDDDKCYQLAARLEKLFDNDTLAQNIYNGDTFEYDLGVVDKPIKIQHGAKASKAIGKLCTALHLNDEFEKFRIAHSQILNQKTFHGTLCLSIHPLDFMTMSDNDCGWHSCMSWENNGCYRQGTVEMMNSPMVVMAYLRAADDMAMPGGLNSHWTNKKWRELFVVTPDLITNVKGYPYRNSFLTTEALNWLRELAEKANIGAYRNEITKYPAYKEFILDETHIMRVRPGTNMMYNDFNDNQMGYFAAEYDENVKYITFNYSGAAECMSCGEINGDFSSEGMLIDKACDNAPVCEECGCHIGDYESTYEVDGLIICEDCYENHCSYDSLTDEPHLEYNLITLYIANDMGYNKYSPLEIYKSDFLMDTKYMSQYFKRIRSIWNSNSGFHYYVRPEDCTERGLDAFGYGFDDVDGVYQKLSREYPSAFEPIEDVEETEVKDMFGLSSFPAFKQTARHYVNLIDE